MSSPSSVGGNNNAPVGIREGTRVILREITANLQNSPPGTSPRRKTGNEAASSTKADHHQQHQQAQQQQHDVKVRFIREFADATSTSPRVAERIPESGSLSSASSFQSLASTLSSKCSSGICVDSSPSKNADRSYLNLEIAGLDDIISACENIQLDEPGSRERSFELRVDSEESSNPDDTFASAADRSTLDLTRSDSPLIRANANDDDDNLNVTGGRRGRTPSPFHRPDEADRNLNVTRELAESSSPTIESADRNLNVTRNVDASSSEHEEDFNLNVTEKASRENSPANFEEFEPVGDLNVTRDLARERSPIDDRQDRADTDFFTRPENEDCADSELNATRNVASETREDVSRRSEASELDVTRNVAGATREDVSRRSEASELDVTRNVAGETREDVSRRSEASELDATRVITSDEDSSTIRCVSPTSNDLDNTREVTGAFIDPPGEESAFEEIRDEETKAGRAESDAYPQPVDRSEEESVVRKFDSALGKTVEVFHTASDEERFAGYEEFPLESITPSISQFHENLCPPVIEETRQIVEETEKNSTSCAREIETTDDLVDFSRISDVKEVTENSQSPALPSLSSVHSISEVSASQSSEVRLSSVLEENATSTIPARSPTPNDEEKRSGNSTAVNSSVVDEFVAAYGGERASYGKSLSRIEEQSCVSVPSLLDISIGISDAKDDVLVASPSDGDTRKVADRPRASLEDEVSPAKTVQEAPLILEFPAVSESEELSGKKENEDGKQLSPRVESPRPQSCGPAETEIEKESFPGDKRDNSNEDLDATVIAEDADERSVVDNPAERYTEFLPQRQSTALVQPKLETQISCVVAGARDDKPFISRPISLTDDYSTFLPQKQSTTLDFLTSPLSSKLERQRTPFVTALTAPEESLPNGPSTRTTPIKRREIVVDRSNFAQLELAANSVANDIFNSSLELADENDHYVSAESELFHDPSNFDFLLSKTPRKNARSNLREVSLYVKFDPLVSNTSMLPQGNIQNASPPTANNEAARNGENNTTIPNIGTPKRNPAIAAIDRLLFYSPMPTNTTPANTNTNIQKTNDAQEKLKPAEETSEDTINMAKELELVRTTVLQLEEQLEKLKIEHEEALEQQTSYKEKINQLQAQLAQEIKHKNEITVVVDEYEISISRLVAERERDRKNLDLEKAKLQEELAAAKHHLDNTEAAFNDVHLKYERLKAVVATYKNNEAALKESLQENVEIIKALENRYEQVKSHATARLEKANQDLEEIRKQNESETVKLRAMLRKAELKSNSLAELVEQKTKENKELTQILDEVIARVGCNKAE